VSVSVATSILQLVALAIPPVAVLIQMLRRSQNLPWKYRQLSFGLAIASVVFFILTGILVLVYFVVSLGIPPLLQVATGLTVLGLLPFALFTLVLYREHKMEFA
jgi:hypothetical protein